MAGWPPVYIITFYFIMCNMYDVYLSKIDEYALVKSQVFKTFFGSKLSNSHIQPPSEGSEGQLNGDQNKSFAVDSGISCLLEEDNHTLSPEQKDCVRSMLTKDSNAKVPGWLRFHIYVGCIDGRVHLVHCKCCAYDFADLLVKLLEGYNRNRRAAACIVKARRRLSGVLANLLKYVSVEGDSSRNLIPHVPQLHQEWDLYVAFINGTLEKRTPRQMHHRIALAGAVILLYSLMPHAFAFRQMCKIIRRSDHQTLIETSAIIDRLLLNFPKEVDVWSVKLFLIKKLFKYIPQNDPLLIDNITTLLDRRCMDIEAFCLAVTEKGQMNGRIPWFLWNLYLHVRSKVLKMASKPAKIRSRRKLDSYFLQMYTTLLLANRGYQGIFYLYLHIVREDPRGLKRLREICEYAETNSSWQANLEILKNVNQA